MKVLEHYCDPDFIIHTVDDSQVLLGVITTAETSNNGLSVSRVRGRQLFAEFAGKASQQDKMTEMQCVDSSSSHLRVAKTFESRSIVVTVAIVDR